MGLDRLGASASALAAILYGTSYVATAIALRSFTPLGTAATRGLLGVLALGAVLLLPIAPALRPPRLTSAGSVRLVVLATLGGPAFIVSMNTAVALAGATITAFVAGLYAVLAAVLAIPLLGERPEARSVVSLALALAGTALLGELEPGGDAGAGIAVGLLAALFFGLFLVLSRRWSAAYGLPGPTVAVGTMGLTAVVVGLLLPLLGQPLLAQAVRPDAVAGVVWLAVGPGALAAILVVTGMRRIPARRASAFLLLNPPTATLGAWLLLGERLSLLQLAGGALVLAAITGASGVRMPQRSARSGDLAANGRGGQDDEEQGDPHQDGEVELDRR